MTAINIPIPSANIVTTLNEAKTFTQNSGWPVVMKLLTPGLLHKADVGGVIVNIKSDSELCDSFEKLSLKVIELSKQYPEPIKIQIQKQIQGGVEVILGIKRDPTFGPVCLFGAGGRYAEILDDHNLELLPLSLENAKTLVGRSKVFKLLSGFRDDPSYQLDQLYEVMITLGQLVTDYPQIGEIEINPLIITHDGVWAVDPKIILS
jgi:acetyltransferase